ncbi:MAG: DUF58 domain-containing protein [Pseudomonadota bacterium]|nr:DUF58 domain-containing protein [Pseudomonadota bacterium]
MALRTSVNHLALTKPQPSALVGAYVELSQLLALRHSAQKGLSSNSSAIGHQSGLKLSKTKGRGADFTEVRQYQAGDDVRSIDWRVTARKNTPHTKVFREERERPVLLFIDQSQPMFFGSQLRLKSVAAADIAARIAWQTLTAGDRVGAVIVDNQGQHLFRPHRSSRSVGRLLKQLADSNQTLNRNPSSLDNDSQLAGLQQLQRLKSNRFRIFVISDFAGDLTMWQDQLQQLARRNQVDLIHVYDPLDAQLPPAGHYAVTDGTQRLQFFSGNRRLRKNYAQQFAHRCEVLQDITRHPAMSYRNVATHDPSLPQSLWN